MDKYNSLLRDFIRRKIYDCVNVEIGADVDEAVDQIMKYAQEEEENNG